jgi:hypothetical protein
MDATRIKFTAATVREVAERVKRITDGAFALGTVGKHAEGGTSYTDAHRDTAWYGPLGARQACAYYTAAAMAWLRETEADPGDDGEFFLAVQVAYGRHSGANQVERQSFDAWEAEGAERARRLTAQS